MDKQATPAVSVAVLEGDRFLLVRRAREPARGLFAFPGGRVGAGETSEQAARRELLEETGLAAGELAPADEFLLADGGGGTARYRLLVFCAVSTSGTLRPGDDADRAGWYTLEEMRALPVTDTTLALAERLAAGARSRGRPLPPPKSSATRRP